MAVKRGGVEVFKRHDSFDLEAAMAAAQQAARSAFEAAGMQDPKVVLSVAWLERGREFVAGSVVPTGTPSFIADSLRLTADEIEDGP